MLKINKKIKRKLKCILTDISKKNILIRKIIRKFFFIKRKLHFLKFYFKNKVNNNMVIFESYMGRNYSCSPKAIYEEMLKNEKFKNFEFIWAFKKPEKYKNNDKLKNCKIVKYGSKKYYEYYSKAKYWVTNSRLPEHIVKKPEQVYIQCWHGTPLKRLGHDIIVESKNALNSKNEIIKKYIDDAKRYTYMLSPSRYATNKFISAFNLKKLNKENIIIEEGYPRNDILYNYKKSDVNRIKKELNIPNNKKIILYAPTWRDDQHTTGKGYTYKPEVDFDYLKEKLEKEYIILFRAHYFVANKFDFSKYQNFIFDVSKIDDINDLYIISDILITDYSSVFFDYANLKRPIIFFMYDLEFYKNKLRGFYLELEELPGDIVENEEEIINIINNMDDYNIKNKEKYEKFNEKFNYLDDGNAARRIIEKIFNN